MSLKAKIQSDMTEAMKAKDDIKVSALRMLKTAITRFEVAGEKKVEAADENIIEITKKEIKQRKDAAEQYTKGNRHELAEKEEKEIKVLEAYLPPQMSKDELRKIVEETIKEVGASSAADMGRVMGAVMPKVKGKADGSVVNKIVRELLK